MFERFKAKRSQEIKHADTLLLEDELILAKPINDIQKESLLEIVENDTTEAMRKSNFQLPEITDNGHSRANATITTLTDENNHSRPESRMISTDMDKRPFTIEMTHN